MNIAKTYNLLKKIGEGEFSEVYTCTDKTDYSDPTRISAIKIIDKTKISNRFRLIKRELEILDKLKHNCRNKYDHHLENVLQLENYFMTGNNICIITELCLEIDLYDLIIDKQQPVEADKYVFVLLDALKFIHSNGIIHRDIKAENVLLRDLNFINNENIDTDGSPVVTCESLVIADFGLATKINDKSSLTEFLGTVSYIAPEVLACNPKNLKGKTPKPYNEKIDVWSLGVLAYFIAFGYMPFDCETDEETIECIQDASYYLDLNDFTIESTSEESRNSFKDFLQCCFQSIPEKRCSIAELKSHPFISNCESLYEMQPRDLKINKSTASLSSFLVTKDLENTPELVSSIPLVPHLSLNTEKLSPYAGSSGSSYVSLRSASTGLYRSKSAELLNTVKSRENIKKMTNISTNNSYIELPLRQKITQQKNKNGKQSSMALASGDEKVEFYL
ncbi:hypothetical protein QEN19_002524 [Hanseniaspora menglaensis]